MPRRAASFALIAASLAAFTGCGAKLHPVSGTVTFGGDPVEGASVTFISDDGKKTFGGLTDASGNYTMYSGEKPGVTAGAYKVLVTKPKKLVGDMTPGSADYMKAMQGAAKEAAPKDVGKSGPFIPGAGPTGSAAPKGELPAIYSAATTTPFSATVPVSGPVNLDLKGPAPKGK